MNCDSKKKSVNLKDFILIRRARNKSIAYITKGNFHYTHNCYVNAHEMSLKNSKVRNWFSVSNYIKSMKAQFHYLFDVTLSLSLTLLEFRASENTQAS